MSASRSTKFDAGAIRYATDRASNVLPLITQQDLGESVPAKSEVAENECHAFDLHHVSPFLHLGKEMRGQLECRVETSTSTFAKTKMTAAERHHRIAVGPSQGQDRVVLVGINMEIVGRRPVDIRLPDHLGFQATLQLLEAVGCLLRRPAETCRAEEIIERRGLVVGVGNLGFRTQNLPFQVTGLSRGVRRFRRSR